MLGYVHAVKLYAVINDCVDLDDNIVSFVRNYGFSDNLIDF